MRYDQRDDGELLELAQAGWAPAFAVLVHRHGPALLAAFADAPDPIDRTVDVFVRAMRHLSEPDPAAPVAPWLFALAGRSTPATVPEPPEGALDQVWRQLDARWPDGHEHPVRRPLVRRAAVAAGAVVLGVLVPVVVLGVPTAAPDTSPATVRAQPLEEEPAEDDTTTVLPDFEFPDVETGATTGGTERIDDAPSTTVDEPTGGAVGGPEPAGPPDPAPDPVVPSEPVDEPTEPPAPDPPATDPPTEPTDPPPATDGGSTDGGSTDGGSTDGSGGGGATEGGGEAGGLLGVIGGGR